MKYPNIDIQIKYPNKLINADNSFVLYPALLFTWTKKKIPFRRSFYIEMSELGDVRLMTRNMMRQAALDRTDIDQQGNMDSLF